ncbi:ATP-binding protein [Burkholderia sp. LMG 13014]|uniref:ATP-binding protein n=2 Tax=Burkholderia sp. LMG 13014 TaxID=2709306 RepID=UPI001F05075F|nr:ATP-binding protein [Burkholderia sp. LMG 13014]
MKAIAEMGLNNPPKTKTELCEKHGEFESRCFLGSVWTKCPTCSAEAVAKEREAEEAKARAERVAAWQRKIGDAGIPERFRDRRLETYVARTEGQRRALAFAKSYADGFDAALKTGRSALFIGKPGTGKTHLAVGVGLQIMERDSRSVLFMTVMRAVRRVKDTWGRNSTQSESEAIASLVFPDLLILDEVGVQFGSDAERLILFDVLNERYEKRRPTLLLSNFTRDEVQAFLGERIFDRLREDGGEFIPFDWESHRGGMA